MSNVINNLTDNIRHSIDEINEHICITNGYDRPRYYLPNKNSAGYLGIEDWGTYPYKPVYASEGTGTLSATKYYSIKVMPVNSDIIAGGFPIYGNATLPSIPQQPSDVNKSFNFTIPVHPQYRIVLTGKATATATGTTLLDSDEPFVADEFNTGYWVKNIETGVISDITDGTIGALITADSMVWTIGDRYQILKSEVTARYIYAAEMEAESSVETSNYYFIGIVTNNTATTYELTRFSQLGETYLGDYFAPPNAFTCHTAGEQLYVAGGIEEIGVGTAAFLGTTETKAANTPTKTVTLIDDDYTAAATSKILRYALDTGAWTNIYEGSYVTVTASNTAGNNVTDARVLRVASDKSWFEILNNNGAADATDATMAIVMIPNVIQGTSTNFSEGMVDAYFEFTNDNVGAYLISWVDVENQELGLGSKYDGNNAATTASYRISSSYSLYWSDYKNPHRFRSVNVASIGDEIKALASIGQYVIVFCEGSVWRHDREEPGGEPTLISDSIFFDATWSVCSNGRMIMFYDGEGISVTDGVSIQSVTGLKAENYLANVNKAYADQIQGIYNRIERRFEFAFPMGTDTQNNYGLYVTEDSMNCMPFSRPDMNVLFSGYENGDFTIYHGTSGELTSGAGTVWKHSGSTDGLDGTEYFSVVTDITGQVATVQANAAVLWAAGDVVTFYPTGSGTYGQYIIKAVTDNTGFSYSLTFDDDYDLTLFDVGDEVLFGIIPFDYGIKWTDFSSPQYLHKVARLFIDLSGMTGKLFVDHYLDLSETAVQTDEKTVAPTDTKLDYKFKKGYGYTYGFRLRGYSTTDFKINSFERVFSTKA